MKIPGRSDVSVQREASEDPGATPSIQQVKSPEKVQIAHPLPVAPSYSYATPTPQASFQSTSTPHPGEPFASLLGDRMGRQRFWSKCSLLVGRKDRDMTFINKYCRLKK